MLDMNFEIKYARNPHSGEKEHPTLIYSIAGDDYNVISIYDNFESAYLDLAMAEKMLDIFNFEMERKENKNVSK